MALTNLEGLVCDPVAGLVEIPCIKRNVIGAMNAVSAADMALAGVVGHIPADEVIDAMAEVGNAMSKDLRETGIWRLPCGMSATRRIPCWKSPCATAFPRTRRSPAHSAPLTA